jgi:hypothetical protein
LSVDRTGKWLSVCLCFCLGAALCLPTAARALDCSSSDEKVSLLALGDAGVPVGEPNPDRSQLVVGRALANIDLKSPADALVLLGDNFYPDGLAADAIVTRIQQNLVEPYCRFLSTAGARWSEVSPACHERVPSRTIPIYAVLGNHDHRLPDSASLQRNVIPQFIANWNMPGGLTETYELGCGVSIIAFDSMTVRSPSLWTRWIAPMEDMQPLIDALRRSRGPWRILVAHRPLVDVREETEERTARRLLYRRRVLEAIELAGVPVQLMLSGHAHYLAADSIAPDSFLNVISGAGASPRSEPLPPREVMFRSSELGFARVALAHEKGQPVLRASLWAAGGDSIPRRLVGWWIDSAGRPHREAAGP